MNAKSRLAFVVDGEVSDLQAAERALAEDGYEVLTASDGKTALKILHNLARPLILLVTDVPWLQLMDVR